VVGSGPSGFYASEAIIRSECTAEVDMYEQLPAPYGLVRSGVAPDHPKLKQPIQVYAGIAETPTFRFFGNVTVGRDIDVAALQSFYHAIIFAYGATSNRNLGIPGEDLPGSHTATEFVGWYNGHPDYRDRDFDLSHEVAVIFGQGNVAADVARILAKTPAELQHTDISAHALNVLRESNIRDIHVIGRRGPAQAKFTAKELREFGELEACFASADKEELILNSTTETELADRRGRTNLKIYELFQSLAENYPAENKRRRVHFSFLKSPVEIIGRERVEKVRLEINRLSGRAFEQKSTGTGTFTELEAGIVFRSIGYKGVPMPGLPFDMKHGVIPNLQGRIMDGDTVMPGLYVSGWIKRGPTGIIGTNRADSVETVGSLLQDIETLGSGFTKGGGQAAAEFLRQKGVRFVTYEDWKKIDRAEIARGEPLGKPREKYTSTQEMLDALNRITHKASP